MTIEVDAIPQASSQAQPTLLDDATLKRFQPLIDTVSRNLGMWFTRKEGLKEEPEYYQGFVIEAFPAIFEKFGSGHPAFRQALTKKAKSLARSFIGKDREHVPAHIMGHIKTVERTQQERKEKGLPSPTIGELHEKMRHRPSTLLRALGLMASRGSVDGFYRFTHAVPDTGDSEEKAPDSGNAARHVVAVLGDRLTKNEWFIIKHDHRGLGDMKQKDMAGSLSITQAAVSRRHISAVQKLAAAAGMYDRDLDRILAAGAGRGSSPLEAKQGGPGKEPGGIDLNPRAIEFETGGSPVQIPLPGDPQAAPVMRIRGLVPHVQDIIPIHHLPALLGSAEQPEPLDLARNQRSKG